MHMSAHSSELINKERIPWACPAGQFHKEYNTIVTKALGNQQCRRWAAPPVILCHKTDAAAACHQSAGGKQTACSVMPCWKSAC